MANTKNLKRYGKEKPPLSREEAVKNGRKGGQAYAGAVTLHQRAVARFKEHPEQLDEILDALYANAKNPNSNMCVSSAAELAKLAGGYDKSLNTIEVEMPAPLVDLTKRRKK